MTVDGERWWGAWRGSDPLQHSSPAKKVRPNLCVARRRLGKNARRGSASGPEGPPGGVVVLLLVRYALAGKSACARARHSLAGSHFTLPPILRTHGTFNRGLSEKDPDRQVRSWVHTDAVRRRGVDVIDQPQRRRNESRSRSSSSRPAALEASFIRPASRQPNIRRFLR